MKNLNDLTKEEALVVAELLGEKTVLDVIVHNYDNPVLPRVSIWTTSTTKGSRYDTTIGIYKNGKIVLHRNDGGWHTINPLPVTDYLRARGYQFEYVQKWDRRNKLEKIKNHE